MKRLLNSLENLKITEIKNLIKIRLNEFAEIKKESEDIIFQELCFCIMTANCNAEKCIEVHKAIGDDFVKLTEAQLSHKFKELGYRFPNIRASYIIKSRDYKIELKNLINSNKEDNKLREWIVKNIIGIGYKEASHFLRNIGYKNYAIIDFHVVDILVKYNLIERPKTMTKKKYLEIENLLKYIADNLNLSLAELDLYLWYMETGKVLK